jgi:hypothetical protein
LTATGLFAATGSGQWPDSSLPPTVPLGAGTSDVYVYTRDFTGEINNGTDSSTIASPEDLGLQSFYNSVFPTAPAYGRAGLRKAADGAVGLAVPSGGAFAASVLNLSSSFCSGFGQAILPGSQAAGVCIDPSPVLVSSPQTIDYAPTIDQVTLEVLGPGEFAFATFFTLLNDNEIFNVSISAQDVLNAPLDLNIDVNFDPSVFALNAAAIETNLLNAFSVGSGVATLSNHLLFTAPLVLNPGDSFGEGVAAGAAVTVAEPPLSWLFALGCIALTLTRRGRKHANPRHLHG